MNFKKLPSYDALLHAKRCQAMKFRFPKTITRWPVFLFSFSLASWMPGLLFAQDEEASGGGGMMKTMLGFIVLLIGVGLGIAAVVYPSPKKGGAKPPH